MIKEKYLQFIASFMIVLVLNFPFYITNVYATINSVSVKGSDGIEGFIRAEDYLDFVVEASITDDTITNDQVRLGDDIVFDECSPSPNIGSECTLRFPGAEREFFEVNSISYTIRLLKDDGTTDTTVSDSVIVDNLAPQVVLSINQNTFSSQDQIVIDYDVTDYACNDPSCSGKCVGIKNIEFLISGNVFETIEPTTNECNLAASIIIDPNTFSAGLNAVFAQATDIFDQVSQ